MAESTAVIKLEDNGNDLASNDVISADQHSYRSMGITELQQLLNDENVSKNQKKKIKKQIKWLETSDSRKEERKKRKIKYKERNAAEGRKRPKFETITTTENFDEHCHIAIDLSFNKLMHNKDIKKLAKQIAWCYKENRRSSKSVQYHICGLDERLNASLDPSYKNWDVHFDKSLLEVFSKEKITYLTAESDNVLDEVKPGVVYAIGGLVDHNHEKGLCHRLAEKNEIATARLPLEENVDIKTRKVLTVNHVFEILLAFLETGNWKDAILKIMPAKKFNPAGQTTSGFKAEETNTSVNTDI